MTTATCCHGQTQSQTLDRDTQYAAAQYAAVQYAAAQPAAAQPTRTTSPEERDRRRAEGLCYYCGDANHIASRCPKAPRRAVPPFSSSSSPAPASPQGNVLPALTRQ